MDRRNFLVGATALGFARALPREQQDLVTVYYDERRGSGPVKNIRMVMEPRSKLNPYDVMHVVTIYPS